MLKTRSFEENLNLYAEIAIKIGTNLQPKQELIIEADIEAAPLARLALKQAYRAGASFVTIRWRDEQSVLDRLENADDDTLDETNTWIPSAVQKRIEDGNIARLVIVSGNSGLLKNQDSSKISRMNKAALKANHGVLELVSQGALNWSIIAYATPQWAASVFPDINELEALNKLWEGIFKSVRVDTENPVEAWKLHNEKLKRRAEYMNEKRYDALHFKGPNTDVVIGLADGHRWAGGTSQTKSGIINNPNMPTEEIFTTPHKDKVDGVLSSTKPLFYQGSVIDGITVTFKDGKIIEGHAEVGDDIFQNILNNDEGSRRIGEVALVPHGSPISKSGILYKHTLFDENASCHVALGRSYPKCMLDSENLSREELAKRGANNSVLHVDWMIGSDKIDIDGIKNGKATPLMRAGELVFDS